MADINTGKAVTFDMDRATLTIDGDTVLDTIEGTFRFKNARRGLIDPAQDRARGALPAKLRQGAEEPGEASFDVRFKAAGLTTSSGLFAIANNDTSADGYMPDIGDIVVQIPDVPGGANGDQITIVNAALTEMPELSPGVEVMSMTFAVTFTKKAAVARFGS